MVGGRGWGKIRQGSGGSLDPLPPHQTADDEVRDRRLGWTPPQASAASAGTTEAAAAERPRGLCVSRPRSRGSLVTLPGCWTASPPPSARPQPLAAQGADAPAPSDGPCARKPVDCLPPSAAGLEPAFTFLETSGSRFVNVCLGLARPGGGAWEVWRLSVQVPSCTAVRAARAALRPDWCRCWEEGPGRVVPWAPGATA